MRPNHPSLWIDGNNCLLESVRQKKRSSFATVTHGKIGIAVGSLRKESFSRKAAENAAKLFPDGYTTEIIEIGSLPLYNQDYDADSPAEYTAFRSKVLMFLDMPVLQQPEMSLGNTSELFDADGSISSRDVVEYLFRLSKAHQVMGFWYTILVNWIHQIR
ncbi:MAG: hypothetical protein GX228_04835 [Firmicutes bacterium]|jgi:hypothetical protein|nr:hypothetical protein [Bacillota bacterium]HKM17118.1 NAD(P)H-dependent oxidoreductase [Limnochordia bacterium]